MPIQVSNQKPVRLEPVFHDSMKDQIDMDAILKDFLAPIYTPLLPGHPAVFYDENGKQIDENDILEHLKNCLFQNLLSIDDENFMRELFENVLPAYDRRLNADSLFVAQSNVYAKCPIPCDRVLYVPGDLKDACLKYLKDPNSFDFLQVTEAFVFPQPHICVAFLTKPVFDEYKDFVQMFIQNMTGNFTPETVKKFQDFQKMELNVLEGLILRTSYMEDMDPWSFSRVLMQATRAFTASSPNACLLTPYVSELFLTKNVMFLDMEAAARTNANKLQNLIGDIKTAIDIQLNITAMKHLQKMTSVTANRKKIQAQLANAMSADKSNGKRALFRFRKKPINRAHLAKQIRYLILKQVNVACSENYTKTVKMSYQRPNRRNPDNFNLKGKSFGMQYKPDLHIYMDTSGSISEENYEQSIRACIAIAKYLNVNLYFNSFSHTISECTKLNTRGKTVSGCYREFQKVPKVSGGTNFYNVWQYILASPKRKKELSLMITDFEYAPPKNRFEHPQKLWYVPINTDPGDYKNVVNAAQDFCKAMFHVDGNIRRRILF